MLYDRECSHCDHVEIDRLERVDLGDLAVCPVCAYPTFAKLPCAPGVISVLGNGESALEMAGHLEKRREKSAAGHGNTVIKATQGAHGLTIDDVVTSR